MISNDEYMIIENEEGSYKIFLMKILGQGSFATVYFGINNKTNESVAIKTVNIKRFPNEMFINALTREIEILKKVKGPNIVELKNVIRNEKFLYMVMEYCNGPDFLTFIENERYLSQGKSIKYLKEFIAGYKILYDNKVIHRDIKPANLILHNDVVKIADFGFSRDKTNINLQATKKIGSPLYMSPQVLVAKEYTDKCDVWSIGITFYEMLFGETPWDVTSEVELISALASTPFKFPMKATSHKFLPEIEDLLNRMLKYNEKDRISWNEIFDHPLLKIEDFLARSQIQKNLKSIRIINDSALLSSTLKKSIIKKPIIKEKIANEVNIQDPIPKDSKIEKLNKHKIKILYETVYNSEKSPSPKMILNANSPRDKRVLPEINEIMNYEKEQEKKEFQEYCNFIEEVLGLIAICAKLLINTYNYHQETYFGKIIDWIDNVQMYTLQKAIKLIEKFDQFLQNPGKNPFNFQKCEEFSKDISFSNLKSKLSDEFQAIDLAIHDFAAIILYNDFPSDITHNTLKFLDSQINEIKSIGPTEHTFLNIIDSIILLSKIDTINLSNNKGKIIVIHKGKGFDSHKFLEEQNNLDYSTYYDNVYFEFIAYDNVLRPNGREEDKEMFSDNFFYFGLE